MKNRFRIYDGDKECRWLPIEQRERRAASATYERVIKFRLFFKFDFGFLQTVKGNIPGTWLPVGEDIYRREEMSESVP